MCEGTALNRRIGNSLIVHGVLISVRFPESQYQRIQ
jgi:hypothetical protein